MVFFIFSFSHCWLVEKLLSSLNESVICEHTIFRYVLCYFLCLCDLYFSGFRRVHEIAKRHT